MCGLQAKCADPTLPPPSPTRPQHRAAGTPAPPPSPPPLAAIAHYDACLDHANSITGWVFFVTLAFMAYATFRRYQMRKKFGFPSTQLLRRMRRIAHAAVPRG